MLTSLVFVSALTAKTSTVFRKGITLGVFWNYEYDAQDIQAVLSRFKELGINSISLTVPIFMSSLKAADVQVDSMRTPNEDWIVRFANQAHQEQISIRLNPLVDEKSLQYGPKRGRANIKPTNLKLWWKNYTATMLYFAKIAEKAKAQTLNIGVELESMAKYTSAWRFLIGKVRSVYKGEVAYSINWYQSIQIGYHPAFLKSVDVIGIDSYFPLNVKNDATAGELYNAYRKQWFKLVQSWMANYPGAKFMLGEVGIRPQEGAFTKPWVWDHGTPTDYSVQTRWLLAYCAISKLHPYIGKYLWLVQYKNKGRSFTEDSSGFSPIGKPAESVVAACPR